MPTWLVPPLKWGGIALISAIAIIYVQYIAAAPTLEAGAATDEAGAATDEAPVNLYWVLLVVGMVATIAGFTMDRR
jgi:hypothetical protein